MTTLSALLSLAIRFHFFEWSGMIVSLLAITFLLRKSIWYWYISPLANLLWMAQFLLQGNALSAGLQVSYIIFAVYAIARWKLEERGHAVPRALEHGGTGLALLLFFAALSVTNFADPTSYIELTAVSLFLTANWLTARKHIACWYFWMAGNSLYAVFLWQVHNYGFFLSQFAFLALSIFGLIAWKQAAQNGAASPAPVAKDGA